MRFTLIFSLLGTGALAQMGLYSILMNNLDNSPTGQCHQLSLFTNIVNSANDPKIKDALTGGDASKGAMGQAIVQMLNSKLDPLKANQTIVDGCQGIVATDNAVADCLEMQQADKLNKVLANQTSLDTATGGDAQKQDSLRKLAAALADKANAVKANATATEFCESSVDARCVGQKIAAQYVKLASDDAALNAHFANNATKVQKFKDGAARAQSRLDAQRADAALVDVCGRMPDVLPIDIASVTLDNLPNGGGMPAMPMM